MAVTFNPLAFLRSAPNYLLREYFTRKGLLGHVEWDHLGEYDMEPVFQAIVALPEEVQDSVMHDFRDLHARTRDGGFVKAILDEATYHKVDTDLAERFERMKRHLERTFWIFLHRKEQYWDGANIFWRVDKLTGASQWQARGGLPAQPGPSDEGVVEDLKTALSTISARARRAADGARSRPTAAVMRISSTRIRKTTNKRSPSMWARSFNPAPCNLRSKSSSGTMTANADWISTWRATP